MIHMDIIAIHSLTAVKAYIVLIAIQYRPVFSYIGSFIPIYQIDLANIIDQLTGY
jgi:hypothetical protein